MVKSLLLIDVQMHIKTKDQRRDPKGADRRYVATEGEFCLQ